MSANYDNDNDNDNDNIFQRPPLLAQILDAKNQKKKVCADLYISFLQQAEEAELECRGKNIAVNADFRLTSVPKQTVDPLERNDSLILLFKFYAKMRQSYQRTFANIDEANHHMSFAKLEIFCRDMNLIPKLLTVEELKMLWEMMAEDWYLLGKGTFTVIGIALFLAHIL
jgi:hypothetical protein